MFLRFIEKKKWLTYNGDHDYLRTLFNAAEETDENFLNDRLYWAFFTWTWHRRGLTPSLSGD